MKEVAMFIFLALSAGIQSRPHGVREGDRIVFFGDSITELGMKPKGYVRLIEESLSKEFRNITIIGAGISGHRVPDLQMRVGKDVISKQPTMVVIYIGINDVWHFALNGKGTPRELYRAGLRWLVDTLRSTGASVVLCTPSVVGEKKQGENGLDPMLDEYSEITRETARQSSVPLCDLRKAFFDSLKERNPMNRESGILTYDGVHLSEEGNRLVARELMRALVAK